MCWKIKRENGSWDIFYTTCPGGGCGPDPEDPTHTSGAIVEVGCG